MLVNMYCYQIARLDPYYLSAHDTVIGALLVFTLV